MDLKTVILIVLRRWYIVVPLAVASLAFAASSGGDPTYEVESSFLLVSPAGAADEGTNPLIDSPAGLNSVANVAAVVMHSAPRRAAVAEAGLSSDYLFTVANLEPFVTFFVVSDDPDIAVESATVLATLYVDELAEQQLRFGASAGALVRTELLEISAPEADYSAVRTNQALYAGAGLLLTFLAAFAVEGVAYLRSPKRDQFLALLRAEVATIRYGPDGVEAEAEDESLPPSAAVVAPLGEPINDAVDDIEDPEPARSRWTRRGEAAGRRST